MQARLITMRAYGSSLEWSKVAGISARRSRRQILAAAPKWKHGGARLDLRARLSSYILCFDGRRKTRNLSHKTLLGKARQSRYEILTRAVKDSHGGGPGWTCVSARLGSPKCFTGCAGSSLRRIPNLADAGPHRHSREIVLLPTS